METSKPTLDYRMNPMSQTPNQPDPLRIVKLSPSDARCVDALLQAAAQASASQTNADSSTSVEFETPLIQAEDAGRLDRVQSLLKLMGSQPTPEVPPLLVQQTMNRIAEHRQKQRFAQQVAALTGPRLGFGWNEMLTTAAVILIGLSLVWPMLDFNRTNARKVVCQNNLSSAGLALNRYAADSAGLMPRGAFTPGSPWIKVGQAPDRDGSLQSNTAHLFLLITGQYLNLAALACPDNPQAALHLPADVRDWPNAAAVSYSYQNQYRPEPIRLDRTPQLALLADKNPLFQLCQMRQRLIYQAQLPSDTPSRMHRAAGQNVLLASGAVQWSEHPLQPDGDNIWTAMGQHDYTGTETPARTGDAFLVP